MQTPPSTLEESRAEAEETRADYERQFDEWRMTNNFERAAAPIMSISKAWHERGDLTAEDVEALKEYMRNPLWVLRLLAVSIGQKATSAQSRHSLIPHVLERLADPVPQVRLEAIYTLRVIGDESVISNLDPMLKDPDPEVAHEAGKTIIKFSGRPTGEQGQ
jgi:HEAT repeat protein